MIELVFKGNVFQTSFSCSGEYRDSKCVITQIQFKTGQTAGL